MNFNIQESDVPGTIDIQSMVLKNFDGSKEIDITGVVQEFSVFESLGANFLTAEFLIYDSLSLPTTFPIVGEETITLAFKTPHVAFEESVSIELSVIGISAFERVNERSSSYLLKTVVPEMIEDMKTKVRKAFSHVPINEMVSAIASDYLKIGTVQESETTEGSRTIVIPNMSPTEAINFLCRQAKHPSKIPSNYRFYQTADGFFFKTMESMIREAKNSENVHEDIYYAGNADLVTRDEVDLFGRVESNTMSGKPKGFMKIMGYKFISIGDWYNSAKYGAVESKMRLLDPLTSLYHEKIYNYGSNSEKFMQTVRRGNGGKLLPENSRYYSPDSESRTYFFLTNSNQQNADIEPDQKEEMFHIQVASEILMENIVVNVTLPGDSTKRVGQTIVFDFPEYGSTDDIMNRVNRFVSGEYLILSIRHMYNLVDGYTTTFTCVKNAYERPIEEYARD